MENDRGGVGWPDRPVKEKIGCLWVYIDQESDDVERMITLAGERSTFTCEGLWSDATSEQRRQRNDVAF